MHFCVSRVNSLRTLQRSPKYLRRPSTNFTSKHTYQFPERSHGTNGDREEEPHADLRVVSLLGPSMMGG